MNIVLLHIVFFFAVAEFLRSRLPQFILLGCCLLVAGLDFVSKATAAEYVLIFAGGDSPATNGVSFERQAQQAVQALGQFKPERLELYFASGDAKPAVAVVAEADKRSPAAKELFHLLGRGSSAPVVFRPHGLSEVAGAATLENLRRWFRERGAALQQGDRLLLCFLTHGGQADPPAPAGSYLKLWGNERFKQEELQTLLAQLPAGVQVTLLSTACYAGGWAELNGVQTKISADQRTPLAGFFAAPYDRPAAGCTPKSEEQANQRDYGTCLWAALSGAWGDGAALPVSSDRDEDGSVSLSEAHAFALAYDTTLDLPLKTSDFALRTHSRFGKAGEAQLLPSAASDEQVLAAAVPAGRWLLEALAARCQLPSDRRLAAARVAVRRLEFDLHALAEDRQELAALCQALQRESLSSLSKQYPELAKLQPAVAGTDQGKQLQRFLQQHATAFSAALTALPAYQKFQESRAKLSAVDAERLSLEQRWAGYQRYIQTVESLILLHNLPHSGASQEVQDRIRSLIQEENRPW